MILIIATLIIASIYLVAYQFMVMPKKPHLSNAVLEEETVLKTIPSTPVNTRNKTWAPYTSKFQGLQERIPLPMNRLNHKLVMAGSPMGVLEFLLFKVLALLVVPILALIFLGNAFPKINLLLGSLAVGFFIPEFWLTNKIKKRQQNIRKDLPYIMDLLNLCVSGGLDFMLAVNRVVRDFTPCDLTAELAEVYRETQMGKSRREALKNFAERIDMAEVHSFVRTLIQADRMGSPIAEVLKMQAEDMRVKRFHQGEAMALKAPIKLLIPLFVFILPVVLILIGGPILLQFTRGNIGF